jgi:hypothetical protein
MDLAIPVELTITLSLELSIGFADNTTDFVATASLIVCPKSKDWPGPGRFILTQLDLSVAASYQHMKCCVGSKLNSPVDFIFPKSKPELCGL